MSYWTGRHAASEAGCRPHLLQHSDEGSIAVELQGVQVVPYAGLHTMGQVSSTRMHGQTSSCAPARCMAPVLHSYSLSERLARLVHVILHALTADRWWPACSQASCAAQDHLKQEGGLSHVAHLAAQGLQGHGADVAACQPNGSITDLGEPQQGRHHAALARACTGT